MGPSNVNCWKRMVTCSFDLNLCNMNNFISCVRRINGRPVQRSTTRCHVHDKQAEAVISNFSPIHITKYISKHFRLKPRFHWSKKCICFFIRPNGPNYVAVKKCQNLTLKVTFQLQNPSEYFWDFFENQFRRIGEHLTAILQVWWKKMHFLWSVKSWLQSKMFWNVFVK